MDKRSNGFTLVELINVLAINSFLIENFDEICPVSGVISYEEDDRLDIAIL